MPKTMRGYSVYTTIDGVRFQVSLPDGDTANWMWENKALFDLKQPFLAWIDDLVMEAAYISTGVQPIYPRQHEELALTHRYQDTMGKVTYQHTKAQFMPVLQLVDKDGRPLDILKQENPDGSVFKGGTYYRKLMEGADVPWIVPAAAYLSMADSEDHFGDTFDVEQPVLTMEWVIYQGMLISKYQLGLLSPLDAWTGGYIQRRTWQSDL